jgi:hypothetical protein
VGPRAGLDDLEKRKFLTLLGLELRPLSRPARSQSLYRLSYPGSRNRPIRLEIYSTGNQSLYINNRDHFVIGSGVCELI